MTPSLEKLVVIIHGREEESRENDLNYYRGDLRRKKSQKWLRLRKKAYWGEKEKLSCFAKLSFCIGNF
jgi:hypothetical protein